MKGTQYYGTLRDKYTQVLLDLYDTLPRNERGNVNTESFIHEIASDPQIRFLIECRKEDQGLYVIKFIETLQDTFPFDVSEVDLKRALSLYSLKSLVTSKPKPSENQILEYDSTQWKKKKTQKASITIPKPFSFLYRDDIKPKSIRQQKLEEMVEEKRKEEEFHLNYRPSVKEVPTEVLIPKLQSIIHSKEGSTKQLTIPEPFSFLSRESKRNRAQSSESEYRFKAKEVPGFVKELRFDRMIAEEVKKKKKLKEKLNHQMNKSAPDLMKAFMKPVKQAIREEKSEHVFKAKDVPYYVKEPRYDKMISQDAKQRDSRLKKAAMQSLSKSKMPPRMEKHHSERKSNQEYVDPSLLVKFKARPVPEYIKQLKDNSATQQPLPPDQGTFFQIDEASKGDFSVPGMTIPIQTIANNLGFNKKVLEVVKDFTTTKKHESMIKFKLKKDQEAEETRQKLEQEDRDRKEKHEKAVLRVKEKGLIPKVIKSIKPEAAESLGPDFFTTVMQKIEDRVSTRPLLTEQITSAYSKTNSRLTSADKLRKLAQAKGINLPEFKTWD